MSPCRASEVCGAGPRLEKDKDCGQLYDFLEPQSCSGSRSISPSLAESIEIERQKAYL